MLRLDRILSNLGYAGRAEARGMIISGRVAVRGEIVRDIGSKAHPGDITLDGEPLDQPGAICVMLHKPVGYACSHDQREAPLAYELLPARWARRNPRPESVGRLDRDTSGLLIVTDDHALVHRLTAPASHVEKEYVAEIDAPLDDAALAVLESGTLVLQGESKPCLPARLRLEAATVVRITLIEGRYHQVRRMFSAVGRSVLTLHRVSFGPWKLGDLPAGEWQAVSHSDASD